jgi:hypothetical protein
VYPAVFLIYLISAAVSLLASLALMVQYSIQCNRAGRTSVLYSFFLFYCSLNTLLIKRVIFTQLFNLLSMSSSFS